jgi:emfourin
VAHLRLDLEQTGGFGGITLHHALDTADLAPDAAAEVERLVDAAERAPAPEPPARPLPDAAHYELTIDRDGTTRRLTFDDPAVAPEVDALIARIRAQATRT